MSLLSSIFGNSDTANKVAEGIYNGVDKLVFTDEEKADASREGFKLWIEYQKATQPQNIARRLIALLIVSVWAVLVLVAAFVYPLSPDYSAYLLELLWKAVMPSIVVIISFYFYKRIASEK